MSDQARHGSRNNKRRHNYVLFNRTHQSKSVSKQKNIMDFSLNRRKHEKK